MTGERAWVPWLAGWLCAATGVIDLASALTPELRDRLRLVEEALPLVVVHTAAALTAMAGVLLLLLSRALRRRKVRAHAAVCVLLAVCVVLNVVKGLDVEEAAVSALGLAGLVVLRREFYAVGDPRGRLRAVTVFAVLAVADVLVGLGLLVARRSEIAGRWSFAGMLREVCLGLVGVSGPLRFRVDGASDVVGFILGGLGILTAVVVGYLLLRPSTPVAVLSADDEGRLRGLLATHGERDSLGYFALRRDKNVVWSASGKAAVSYRVVSGVMLASGDPLGDPEAWPGAIAAFRGLAARHAWTPAVIGCSERGARVWARQAGLEALELGDEAVVDTAAFSLSGRAMRNVRQMVNRVERGGYECAVRRVEDLAPEEIALIRRQASAWRNGPVERGFSMALDRLAAAEDRRCVVATAHQDGQLRALLHFVPWGADGLSLDLMRRDRAADAGLSELLIVATLRAAPWLGVRRVSLNFAVFRGALERGEQLGAGPVARLQRRILLFASRWFQIDSLYRFNAKFLPTWQRRLICFPSAADIPRVGLAALRAEAFLYLPRPRFVLGRRAVAPARERGRGAGLAGASP